MERNGVQTPIGSPQSLFLSLHLTPPLPFKGKSATRHQGCRKTEGSAWLPGKVMLLVTRTRTLPLGNCGLLGGPSVMEGGICTKLSLYILEEFIGFLKGSPTCPGLPRAVLVLKLQVPCPKNLCSAGKTRMVGHLVP